LRERIAAASPKLRVALRIQRLGNTFRFALPRITLIAAK
jgi:hypothetical protein